MRIGFFADMYLPHVSGVTNHISLYKQRFEDLGHEVFVFTFGDRDYDDAEPNVVRSPGMPWGETGWRFALSLSSEARRLAETLDIIHVHHPFQSGRLAAPIARRAGIPLVFTNHTRYDLYSDAYATFVPSAVRYAYLRASLGGFLRRCDLVVAPAASIAEWLHEFTGFDDATVVPNGVDTTAFAQPHGARLPRRTRLLKRRRRLLLRRSSRPREEHPLARRGVRSCRGSARRARGCSSSATARRRPEAEAALAARRRSRTAHVSSAWCPTTACRTTRQPRTCS